MPNPPIPIIAVEHVNRRGDTFSRLFADYRDLFSFAAFQSEPDTALSLLRTARPITPKEAELLKIELSSLPLPTPWIVEPKHQRTH